MKAIDGYEGYFITELGEVFSTRRGNLHRLKPALIKAGYLQVVLRCNGTNMNKTVHRLVAEAFIPNPQNLYCVCHKNDIKTDNHIDNLFWGSLNDNVDDRGSKNRTAKGEIQGKSLLTSDQVIFIRSCDDSPESKKRLAVMFNVNITAIYCVMTRRTWKHI